MPAAWYLGEKPRALCFLNTDAGLLLILFEGLMTDLVVILLFSFPIS